MSVFFFNTSLVDFPLFLDPFPFPDFANAALYVFRIAEGVRGTCSGLHLETNLSRLLVLSSIQEKCMQVSVLC